MQAARARADEVLAGAPLDNGDVDPRQRQLARQHQPRRTASGDHHRMLGHRHPPGSSVDFDNNARMSLLPFLNVLALTRGSGQRQRLYATPPGLPQAPRCAIT